MHPAPTDHASPDAMRSAESRPEALPSKPAGVWKRALALIALAGVLVLGVVSDTVHAGLVWLLSITEPVIASQPIAGAVVFVLLSAISAMMAFFSSAVLVPVALDVWSMPLTGALLWTGWTLGGAGAYAVGRFLGRAVATRFVSDDVLARYEHWVSARAPFGLVVLFLLALQSEVPGYALGLARYDLGRYMLAVALVEVPFTLLTLYIGAGLVERRLPLLVGAGAGALLLIGIAFLILRSRFRAAPASEEVTR